MHDQQTVDIILKSFKFIAPFPVRTFQRKKTKLSASLRRIINANN